MFKKIVSLLLVVIMISSLCIIVNAEEQYYSEKQVKINYDGVVLTETVIVDKNGVVLAPVSWLEAFGLLKCQETETYYKFYYPDQEQNDTFAKRIWICKDGTHFDIRYYEDNNSWLDELSEYYDWIKGSIQSINQKSLEGLKEQWDIKEKNLENLNSEMRNSFSILSEDFSTQTQYKDELYLPITELLPLINAKITFSDTGIIYIYPNYVSLSQALYDVNIGSLVFDADDIVGKDFVSATSLVLDTVFNFRFDRLDFVNKNGVQTDYQELFKNLLVDDDTFLSLYDKETTPHDEALKYYIYQCDDLGNRVDLLKCLRTALDDVGVAKELYPDVFNFLTADYSETIKVGTSDVIEGIAKTLDYQQTYNNQIDDHRKMLGAVYGYESTNSPAKQAAYTVQALYGEKYADKLLAAVETGLRDFICVYFKDAVSKVVAPYSVALTITKLIKPDEFETIHAFSLLDIMDETAETSYDVYISRKFSGEFDTKSLDDLRLSAMMTLVSSRYAYSAMYDGQHENIDKIDEVLKKIYLSADGVECDSSDYYAAKVKDLKGKISKLDLSAGSDNSEKPNDEDFKNRIIGTWYATIDGEYGEITFNADNTGKISAQSFTQSFSWHIEGDTLYYVNSEGSGGANEMTIKFEGDILYLTSHGDTQAFKRKQSNTDSGSVACEHKQTQTVTVTVATCTEDGKENIVCKSCNEIIKSNVVTAPGHNFKNGKCTVCGENSSSFIDPIPTVETINVAALTHNTKSISKITQSSTSIDAANLKVYNGNITKINQIDEYSFVATRNGTYRIEIDGMSADMAVSLYIFNDSGKQISYDSSLFNNGEGLTVELVANKTYTIEVREFHQIYSSVPTLGSYTLNIWNQKPTVDVTNYTQINDSIEYFDQSNYYTFTPSTSGTYRIEVTNMKASTDVMLYIYNDLDERIAYDSSLFNNGEGLTVTLTANKTYTIAVYNFHQNYEYTATALGSYTLNIWNQKPTVDVTNYTQINDSIEYFDQSNYYTFTPSTSGTYRIEVTNMKASTDVMLYIYNDLDERIAYDSSLFNNGEGLTVTLTANKTYTIAVYNFHQNYEYTATALGSYTLNIWNQKPSVDVIGKVNINDSIQYADQENIYNFTADSTGDFIIRISNMKSAVTTSICVYNNLDEKLAYDTSFRNNDSVSLKNLEMGTNYRIVIEQSSGTGSYTLTIE